jgi:hypothetical protein
MSGQPHPSDRRPGGLRAASRRFGKWGRWRRRSRSASAGYAGSSPFLLPNRGARLIWRCCGCLGRIRQRRSPKPHPAARNSYMAPKSTEKPVRASRIRWCALELRSSQPWLQKARITKRTRWGHRGSIATSLFIPSLAPGDGTPSSRGEQTVYEQDPLRGSIVLVLRPRPRFPSVSIENEDEDDEEDDLCTGNAGRDQPQNVEPQNLEGKRDVPDPELRHSDLMI